MPDNIVRFILASLVALALLGCQEEKNTKPSTPIAVINQVEVYEKSTTIKAARERLNSTFEKLTQEMVVLNELAEKEKDKDKAKKMVEEGVLEAQQRFAAEEQLVTSKVATIVEKTIKECRAELGATIIISNDLLIDYDEKADISSMVIEKIDTQTISFDDPDLKAEDEQAEAEASKSAEVDEQAATTNTKTEVAPIKMPKESEE